MENASGTGQVRERQQTPTSLANQTDWEPQEIDPELASVLWSKRWEKRDKPFQGFGSPQGKF